MKKVNFCPCFKFYIGNMCTYEPFFHIFLISDVLCKCGSVGSLCNHERETTEKLSPTLNNIHHPCYTCHSIKSDFSHEHGQHINNSFILLHKISLLYQNHDLSDIQIGVGHKVFHAHRLILSSSSDVFSVMLTNPTWPESRKTQVHLFFVFFFL